MGTSLLNSAVKTKTLGRTVLRARCHLQEFWSVQPLPQPSVFPNSSLIAQDFRDLGELGEGLEDIGGRGSINSAVGKSSFLLCRLSRAVFRQEAPTVLPTTITYGL